MEINHDLGSDGTMYRVEEHWERTDLRRGKRKKKLSLELLGVRC